MKENNPVQLSLFGHLKTTLRRLLNLLTDKAPEAETIESIKAGVDFHGAKLWILILAIFVASLGLNTNSAAVIIGAMLISPVMGPIIGMGLGVGINDFELLKRAFRSFVVATVFSILTATLYFFVTPIAEAQSELLARTSPTIYDVLIALCGGLAGIIALCSVGQRNGNVIPGVAIATALMPPLCTTGFGIATGNWTYAAGAFYLYLINTIFISFATFIGVNIMHFRKKVFVDPVRERKVKRIITFITIVTILPSAYLTYNLVLESMFTKNAMEFVNRELSFEGTQTISKSISYAQNSISVVLLGQEVTEKEINTAKNKLAHYHLQDVTLSIVQGSKNVDYQDLQKMIRSQTENQNSTTNQNTELIASQQKKIEMLEQELTPYRANSDLAKNLQNEVKILFPEVTELSVCRGVTPATSDTLNADTLTAVLINLNNELANTDEERIKQWIQSRLTMPGRVKFYWEHNNETSR